MIDRNLTNPLQLRFEDGILCLLGCSEGGLMVGLDSWFTWDHRRECWITEPQNYREIVIFLHRGGVEIVDGARAYQNLELALVEDIIPRKHQSAALKSWRESGKRGVVSLPTGAGKTILAILAMAEIKRPTLVVVPTIDLLHQWIGLLVKFFGIEIGALGGGRRDLKDITVSTYDSAALLAHEFGNQFGLLVYDECHHLPSPSYRMSAVSCIAPFRLGLSATIFRPDGKEEDIFGLLGPLVFEGAIKEMIEKVLAPYDVVTVEVPLTDDEWHHYHEARKVYTDFLRRNRINMASRLGWGEFIKKASFMPGGREALQAHRRQKSLAQGASGKIQYVWDLLVRHAGERTIIFTNDNELAYRIGTELALPVITHKTKLKERALFLEKFRQGALTVLVTSRVLNEGVDVPDAGVAIVVSGTSGVREHVQRLGRVLRHKPGKRAKLYELIAEQTSESYVKERRRQHSAYQGSP